MAHQSKTIREVGVTGVLLALPLLTSSACIALEQQAPKSSNIDRFNIAVVESQKKLFAGNLRLSHDEIDNLFDQYFDVPAALAGISDQELKRLYRAAYTASYYGPHRDQALLLKRVSEELAAREVDFATARWLREGNHFQATRDALLNARLIDMAESFVTSFDLGDVPWRVESELGRSIERPTILRVVERGTPAVLSRQVLALNQGVKVIASVHPDCGFSRNAMEFIAESDGLLERLSNSTIWVSRQEATSDLDAVIEWNENHEATEIGIAYLEDEWPEFIALYRTPVFYVLRDGNLVQRIVGWPGPEQGGVLRQALMAADEN